MDLLWTCARRGSIRRGSIQQKYGVWWGDKWHAPTKAFTYYNSSHTRVERQAPAVRGWTAVGRQDGRIVAWCSVQK